MTRGLGEPASLPTETDLPVGAAPPQADLMVAVQDAARTGSRVVALRLTSYAVGFLASVLLARALGPAGRGQYAYPLALLGLAMAVGHLGLEHANVYLASQGVALRTLWASGLYAGSVLGVAMSLVPALLYLFLGERLFSNVPLAWLVVAFAQAPILLMSLYWTSVLQLGGRLKAATGAALLGVCFHTALTVAMVLTGLATPFRVLLLSLATNTTTWISLLALSQRAGVISCRLAWDQLRRAAAFGLKAHVGLIAIFLVLRVDQVLVKGLLGYRALGLYALATMLAELLWMTTDPIAGALLPHQVRAEPGDERRLGYTTARLLLTASLLIAAVAWLLAPWGISLVYGTAFSGAGSAFRWLLPGVVVSAVQRPLGAVVLKDGRALFVSLLGFGAVAFNVGANLLVLPLLGIAGAAAVSSLTYGAVTVAYVLATRRPGVADWRDLVPRPADVGLLLRPMLRRVASR